MWKPSIKGGTIGRSDGRSKESTWGAQHGAINAAHNPPTTPADDVGRAKYYVNPHGFTGLHGFELDKPSYAKNKDWRQPRAGSAQIWARKGEPFDA